MTDVQRYDAIVVGAGFAGMHMLWKLRELGMTALVIERGSDLGGTWYWNRYPGARCDVPSLCYSVPWDPQADQEWDWSEVYSAQPEILDYVNYLAERNDLRRDIKFDTLVTRAAWDEAGKRWTVETDSGDSFESQFFISAAGALSEPNIPDIPGIATFAGELHHTGRWPKEKVDFAGKRVAVLGTGSTGVQASTAIAKEADHLYVLQRTAQYSLPCGNVPLTDTVRSERKSRYPEHREWQRTSVFAAWFDIPAPFGPRAFDDPKEKRFENYEMCWQSGTPLLAGAYWDLFTNAEVAQEISDFVRDKIRGTVKDPVVAERLCPAPGSYIGVRRIIIDTGYYQIFNQPNVTLVDIQSDPIVEITQSGVRTKSNFYELDVLVVATGYDAGTGPLLALNITGKDGVQLKDAWADGPHSYLGLMAAGFPNMFMITGPSSPGVHANVIFSIDQHVNWIGDCLAHMRATGAVEIDTTPEAQDIWQAEAAQTYEGTLRWKDVSSNWYLGANVAGKPRAALFYQGGLGNYKNRCDEVAADNYRGFVMHRTSETAPA